MKISFEQEKKLLQRMYMALGMSEKDAAILSAVPTQSDFTGVESHGLSRAMSYVTCIKSGAMEPNAELKVIFENENMMSLDCGDGVGVIGMVKGYELLREKVMKTGIAFGTGNHSTNIGCGNYYAWRAAQDDLILVACANTSPLQAPFGGADPLIGSNPIIACSPSGSFPLMLDIATTLVAFGKIMSAQRKNSVIPDSWCLDKDGKPTSDSHEYYTNTPMAAHKGYGLAVMVDVFSAILSGAAFGSDIGFALNGEKERSGWSMLLIDPSKFMPIELYKSRVDEYIKMMKDCRRAEGAEEIFLPGEIEYNTFQKRMTDGFEIEPSLEALTLKLAVDCGLGKEGDTLQSIINSL